MAKEDGQFKPGKSGNPKGRPALPPEVRKSLRLTNEEFIRVASEFLLLSAEEIKLKLTDPKANAVELLVGNLVTTAIYPMTDDYMRAVSLLLDRTIGKVKESVEITIPKPTIIRRRNGEEVVLGSEMQKKDEE